VSSPQAGSEFPRGWTINSAQNASGAAPDITLPNITGIVHVLDSLTAKWTNYATTAAAATPTLTVTNAGQTVLQTILAVGTGAIGTDSVSFSGLNIASPPGSSFEVKMSAGPGANQFADLTIQGWDI
jgi:hypothetical protein